MFKPTLGVDRQDRVRRTQGTIIVDLISTFFTVLNISVNSTSTIHHAKNIIKHGPLDHHVYLYSRQKQTFVIHTIRYTLTVIFGLK